MSKPLSPTKLTPESHWLSGTEQYAHRLDPSEVEQLTAGHTNVRTNDDGSETYQWLDENGQLHRLDGPAAVTIHTGVVTEVQYFQHGQLDRTDGPAQLEFQDGAPIALAWEHAGVAANPYGPAQLRLFPDGSIAYILWANAAGQKHRVDAPAMQRFNVEGYILEEEWWKDGQLHRPDGPAVTLRNEMGEVEERWFYQEHKLHNELGPAHEAFYPGGAPKERVYYTHGLEDRSEGPYFASFHGDGSLAEHRWATKGHLERVQKFDEAGKFHCENGPAVLKYKKDGTVKTEQFWFHGHRQSSLEELHEQERAENS